MKVRIVGILILCLALTGCAAKTTVVNTPAGVTSDQVAKWKSAAENLDTVQRITHAALVSAIALNHSGVIPDSPEYGLAIQSIGHAEQLEIEAAKFLKTVPNDWALPTQRKIQDSINQILAQLTAAQATGVLHVADATGKVISDTIKTGISILQTVQTLQSRIVYSEKGAALVI